MGFDYRFMYERLYNCIGDFVRVGDVNTTKAFYGQGLAFYDMALIIGGGLGNIAKEMFKNDPSK
jgi:hypothetical protein